MATLAKFGNFDRWPVADEETGKIDGALYFFHPTEAQLNKLHREIWKIVRNTDPEMLKMATLEAGKLVEFVPQMVRDLSAVYRAFDEWYHHAVDVNFANPETGEPVQVNKEIVSKIGPAFERMHGIRLQNETDVFDHNYKLKVMSNLYLHSRLDDAESFLQIVTPPDFFLSGGLSHGDWLATMETIGKLSVEIWKRRDTAGYGEWLTGLPSKLCALELPAPGGISEATLNDSSTLQY